MPSKYASGKYAIAECDRCDGRYMLKELRTQTLKTKPYKIKVCRECWDPDQPQLQLGMYPVNDPQAVRDPRPDVSYLQSGQTGLMTNLYDPNVYDVDEFGYPAGGSRQFQWGWAPVGGARGFDTVLTPNYLIAIGQTGTVSITTT
jgi:hypothetical protein